MKIGLLLRTLLMLIKLIFAGDYEVDSVITIPILKMKVKNREI